MALCMDMGPGGKKLDIDVIQSLGMWFALIVGIRENEDAGQKWTGRLQNT